MKKLITVAVGMLSVLFACTSAVISGKATPDGRPLLWKHRDTGSLENKLVYVSETGYDFVGVANVKDPANKEIWMGVNETGFAVMNTASYNIGPALPASLKADQEGLLMRLALETCSSVDEFETLLRGSAGEWGIAANFGVIDARGNAAYFETGFDHYVKFDVNDPDVAPEGYLIRTNFSVSGGDEKGQGYLRYDATRKLFSGAELTPEFIILEATRNMHHGALREHLGNMKLPKDENETTLVAFQDYIVRYWSASVLVVQGVRDGEDPRGSMLWPIMGFPLTAMATPVFFSSADGLPAVLTTGNEEAPFMTAAALKLKDELFPVAHDDKENYLDAAKLKNRKKTGYMQILMEKENEILSRAKDVRKDPNPEKVREYYRWLDEYVCAVYTAILPPEPLKHELPRCGETGVCK